MTHATLLIDDVLPSFDATIIEHIVIDAPPEAVFATVREMDFLRVSSPVADAAMWVRGLPDQVASRLGRQPPAPEPPSMRLAGLFDQPANSEFLEGWVGLGERAPDEIVFGAVGKVWQPEIEWRTVAPADFPGFREPEWAKIAAGFSLRPYGSGRTLLTYEARTANTDEASRRRFLRYWWLVRRFVAVIMRAALRTAKEIAEGLEPEATTAS